MDKLAKLLAHCKCSLLLHVNDHRDYYQSAEQKLNSPEAEDWEIPDDVRAKIIETDTLVELVFHPDTPIGFYHILHYDLDAALDEALGAILHPS